ncbi:hypothetical protein [Flaviaesturariibacter amylovorans]|uniref:Aspartyl protease n=1 Tax=Flaviaesturariibacter amylovorans TaxID=1084520 RepID=A0ABP8GAU1_9BACT
MRLPAFLLALAFFASVLVASAQAPLRLPAGTHRVPFEWLSSSTPAGPEPHAALLLPVVLPGCPERLYLQFDLGAPHTILYTDAVAGLRARHPRSLPAPDSAGRLRAFAFRLGTMAVEAPSIGLKDYDTSGAGPRIIGTAGSDLVAGRIVAIDYPGRALVFGDSLPAPLRAGDMTPLVWAAGRVLLPAVVQGRETMLFFDTGSSAFPLLTDSMQAAALSTRGAAMVSYPVRSWGRTLTANQAASADSITIGHRRLPLRTVTWMGGVPSAQVEGMRRMGIGGMTGNALFSGSVLVLDLKAKQFAVLPAGAPDRPATGSGHNRKR